MYTLAGTQGVPKGVSYVPGPPKFSGGPVLSVWYWPSRDRDFHKDKLIHVHQMPCKTAGTITEHTRVALLGSISLTRVPRGTSITD